MKLLKVLWCLAVVELLTSRLPGYIAMSNPDIVSHIVHVQFKEADAKLQLV